MAKKSEKAKRKFEVGSVEFDYLVFRWRGHELIVGADGMENDKFEERFGPYARRVNYIYESYDGITSFFVVYQEDCYDPPLTVVRARCVEDAIDNFVDNTGIADVRISDEDLKDFCDCDDKTGIVDPDSLVETIRCTGSGNNYNSDSMMVSEAKLLRAEMA